MSEQAIDGLIDQLAGDVRTFRFDRPDRANALTLDMMTAIAERLRWPARGTVIAGARSFSSGVDTDEIRRDASATGHAFFAMLEAAAGSPAPLIAAVEGVAVGGGWLLAACADRIYASASARFSLPEITMGIPPFVAFPLLRDQLGSALWSRAALAGQELSAVHLEAVGAVEIVDDPLREAQAEAGRLSALDGEAYARLKLFARSAMLAGIREARTQSFAHIDDPARRSARA